MVTMSISLFIFSLIFFGPSICRSEARNRNRRMVNGVPADLADWHFTAWLVKNKPNYPDFCGGVLIKFNWVLTAAHCVNTVKDKPELLSIRIGSTNTSELKSEHRFYYPVKKIIVYPGYEDEGILNDDIALIKLAYPVKPFEKRTVYPRPARLGLWRFKNSNRYISKCKVAGWGKVESFTSLKEMNDSRNSHSMNLMSIDVPILGRKHCIAHFKTINGTSLINNTRMFWNRMICGGDKNPSVGTPCLYDSGSPMICEDEYGSRELHGIAIAIHGPHIKSRPCTPGLQISIFIRVAEYASWILEKIKEGQCKYC